jgi:hypothetical protein
MRRGQFQHVFTFLMLMIIAGIVLLLGYRFLTGILGDACEVEHVAFSEKIQDALTDYASYGSFHTPALAAPCNAQMICFIDARNFKLDEGVYIQNTDIAYDPAPTITYRRTIDEEVRNPSFPTPHNIFLIQEDDTARYLDIFAEKVFLDDPTQPLCVEARSGKFRLGFEGRGRTVLISNELGGT